MDAGDGDAGVRCDIFTDFYSDGERHGDAYGHSQRVIIFYAYCQHHADCYAHHDSDEDPERYS